MEQELQLEQAMNSIMDLQLLLVIQEMVVQLMDLLLQKVLIKSELNFPILQISTVLLFLLLKLMLQLTMRENTMV